MHREQEKEELSIILNSKPFANIIDEHKNHILKDMKEAIRQQNILMAYGELMKLDDIDRIFGLVKLRLTELGKGE